MNKRNLRGLFFICLFMLCMSVPVIASASSVSIILWAGDSSVESKKISTKKARLNAEAFATSEQNVKYKVYCVKNGRKIALLSGKMAPGTGTLKFAEQQADEIPTYVVLSKANKLNFHFATGKATIASIE